MPVAHLDSDSPATSVLATYQVKLLSVVVNGNPSDGEVCTIQDKAGNVVAVISSGSITAPVSLAYGGDVNGLTAVLSDGATGDYTVSWV